MQKNAKERIHTSLSAISAKRQGLLGTAPKKEGRVKVVAQAQGEIKELVVERGSEAFCMQLQALEIMAAKEKERERRCNKRQGKRGKGAEHREDKELAREATTCGILLVWEAIQKLMKKGINHMEWDNGLDKFIKARTQDHLLMEVQVKVLSLVQNQFL